MSAQPAPADRLDCLTVVIPARDAAGHIGECLTSVVEQRPTRVIVVDGRSKDDTVAVAAALGADVVSDGGRGLPFARTLGAGLATTRYVALVDSDVVLPAGSLTRLLDELRAGGYTALQAGLVSTSGPGYWGRALAEHHRTGRSRNWFGLVATVVDREALLAIGFDDRFSSGEDIDLRWRLRKAGARTGVSQVTIAEHRFTGDDFGFARAQWLADGSGLARMARVHGGRGAMLTLLPLAATLRGVALTVLRGRLKWLPYYLCYCAYNYRALLTTVLRPMRAGPGSP